MATDPKKHMQLVVGLSCLATALIIAAGGIADRFQGAAGVLATLGGVCLTLAGLKMLLWKEE